MNRIFAILFVLFFPFGCYAGSKNEYPTEIEKLGYNKQYDEIKWRLYCIMCDRHLPFNATVKIADDSTTYGNLPLLMDKVNLRTDTVEMTFLFYYKNQKVNINLVEATPIWGAAFKMGTDKIIYFISKTVLRYSFDDCMDLSKPCKSRDVKPLQPEVVKYIKENKDKLDPWFRKEAIKRGVINE